MDPGTLHVSAKANSFNLSEGLTSEIGIKLYKKSLAGRGRPWPLKDGGPTGRLSGRLFARRGTEVQGAGFTSAKRC